MTETETASNRITNTYIWSVLSRLVVHTLEGGFFSGSQFSWGHPSIIKLQPVFLSFVVSLFKYLTTQLISFFISLCSSLDPNLQDALKEYLLARGIGDDLTNFLVIHLHRKEQTQYTSWLHKLEAMMAKDDWSEEWPSPGLTHTCPIHCLTCALHLLLSVSLYISIFNQ